MVASGLIFSFIYIILISETYSFSVNATSGEKAEGWVEGLWKGRKGGGLGRIWFKSKLLNIAFSMY